MGLRTLRSKRGQALCVDLQYVNNHPNPERREILTIPPHCARPLSTSLDKFLHLWFSYISMQLEHAHRAGAEQQACLVGGNNHTRYSQHAVVVVSG